MKYHLYASQMGRFPSGQRGQTVNLLQLASVVRIHLCPLQADLLFKRQNCLQSRRGGTGRRTGLKILRALSPVPVRFRSPALFCVWFKPLLSGFEPFLLDEYKQYLQNLKAILKLKDLQRLSLCSFCTG